MRCPKRVARTSAGGLALAALGGDEVPLAPVEVVTREDGNLAGTEAAVAGGDPLLGSRRAARPRCDC